MGEALTGLGALGTIFLVVLAILWFLLPIAVFGIKSRLDTVIKLLSDIKKQNETVNPELKKIDRTKSMEACLDCDYLTKETNKCKKTGWNIDVWQEKFFKKVRMNPCEGSHYRKIIDKSKTLEACLKCSHYLENSGNLKQCKKTKSNLVAWAKDEYLETKMNPCEGNYFIEK